VARQRGIRPVLDSWLIYAFTPVIARRSDALFAFNRPRPATQRALLIVSRDIRATLVRFADEAERRERERERERCRAASTRLRATRITGSAGKIIPVPDLWIRTTDVI